MEIYPQNLGERNHVEVVRRRVAEGYSDPNTLVNQPLTPKLGILGRYWARGTKINDAQAAVGSPAASSKIQLNGVLSSFLGSFLAGFVGLATGMTTHNPALGWTIFTLGATGMAALGFGPIAQSIFRKAHRVLTVPEVEEMITRCQDDLRKSYLQLVRDAVLVPIPDPPAENVRQAIEALGDAIEGLPAVLAEPIDTNLLRQQAQELRDKATSESDPIIAESLVRQAESLEQRAESNERSLLVARRSSTLRNEILAKIAALREALAAQQTGIMDVTALGELSESARHVAREAQNTASAKDELARYLTPQNEEPNIQKVGR
jgi:hypothetical protein